MGGKEKPAHQTLRLLLPLETDTMGDRRIQETATRKPIKLCSHGEKTLYERMRSRLLGFFIPFSGFSVTSFVISNNGKNRSAEEDSFCNRNAVYNRIVLKLVYTKWIHVR